MDPAPFGQLEVVQVATTPLHNPGERDDASGGSSKRPAERQPGGERAGVWLRVSATTPAGVQVDTAYAVQMAARDGRWELAAVEAAPRLDR